MIKTFVRVLLVFALAAAAPALARTLYLNGTDISSARNQILEGVKVRIDGNGNIFIEAPHYQVHEENTYTPLSQWRKEEKNQPASKLPAQHAKVQPPAEKLTSPEAVPVKTETPAPSAEGPVSSPQEKASDDGKIKDE